MYIRKTLLGAFGYVLEYRTSLLKTLSFPALLSVALDLAVLPDGQSELLMELLQVLLYTIIAITTHRIILLGPGAVTPWRIFVPTKRELHFILASIGISLVTIPALLLIVVPVVGPALAFLGICYLFGRFILVLPAIATDRDWTFQGAWNATRDHQLLMLIVIAVFPLVVSIPELILSQVPQLDVLTRVLSVITLVFTVAAISAAYRVVVGQGVLTK